MNDDDAGERMLAVEGMLNDMSEDELNDVQQFIEQLKVSRSTPDEDEPEPATADEQQAEHDTERQARAGYAIVTARRRRAMN
jgi:hypothetical protein